MFKNAEIQTATITTSKKGSEMLVIDHLVDNVGLVKQFVLLDKPYSLKIVNGIQKALKITQTSLEEIELVEFRGVECCVFLDKQKNGKFTNYFVKFIVDDNDNEVEQEQEQEKQEHKQEREIEVKDVEKEQEQEQDEDNQISMEEQLAIAKENEEFEMNLFSFTKTRVR